jgi:hypothetical protein
MHARTHACAHTRPVIGLVELRHDLIETTEADSKKGSKFF